MRDIIPYAPIGRHGVIGDRRTAALVAADGSVDWLCLPDYDDDPVLAALVDAPRGGWWRMGPERPSLGRQRYLDGTAALETTWTERGGVVALVDAMPWPEERRDGGPEQEKRRVVLRRLECREGEVTCSVALAPRHLLGTSVRLEEADGGIVVRLAGRRRCPTFGVWSNRPLHVEAEHSRATARVRLRAGESLWVVFAAGESPARWSLQTAEGALDATVRGWRNWLSRFDLQGEHAGPVARSLVVLHLLGYAPSGAMVAAPTLGLPERIGGPRNYDYRYAWIRDASLSVTALSLMGDTDTPDRYLRWLAGLSSKTDAPLQVAYDVHGGTDLTPRRWGEAHGYRESAPVTFGNGAYVQRQVGSLGYVAECMWTALERGARWDPRYSHLLGRLAGHVLDTWAEADSGIWELDKHQQFVASKVMCWVVLDRASLIAQRVRDFDARQVDCWRAAASKIRTAVLDRGYDERVGALVQRYGSPTLDASVLLASISGLLAPDDPRVLSTLDRVDEVLGLEGFVYRFEPGPTEGEKPLPLGEYEGAFLPCTFWMATARAKAGQIDRAAAIIERTQRAAGELGLFAEEIDPRSGEWLGNYPLLFSHVEHLRAIDALESASAGRLAGSRARR